MKSVYLMRIEDGWNDDRVLDVRVADSQENTEKWCREHGFARFTQHEWEEYTSVWYKPEQRGPDGLTEIPKWVYVFERDVYQG